MNTKDTREGSRMELAKIVQMLKVFCDSR